MQAIAADNWPAPIIPGPSVIGQAFGGGYYAGQIGVNSVATHYLIVGPVASAQATNTKYKTANSSAPGADSDIDGPQNTADLVGDTGGTYPAATFCNNLTIGGFSDWYLPATNELEVCYYNLKPTTNNNHTGSGINPNAVPARASNYTSGTPAQTSAATFVTSTGAEAFNGSFYWSSTESTDPQGAEMQTFYTGIQTYDFKVSQVRVRAIRRVAV
tara:strand:- start:82 stop:726 length:645 start_codon:yes stop_codon:yes gene_type:complete